MKAAIYQYWCGNLPLGYARLSRNLFTEYARVNHIHYRFDENPSFFKGKYSEYYHALRPIYDEWFHSFDLVLYVDMDVFPTRSASPALFESSIGHLAMAEERGEPMFRKIAAGPINERRDARWACLCRHVYGARLPTLATGEVRVFNSGVVLYSRDGMRACSQLFPNRRVYSTLIRLTGLPRFYRLDQNYLGLAGFMNGVSFTELQNAWNRRVKTAPDGTYDYDVTEEKAQFVHLQTRDRKNLSETEILAVVNGG